mmetsp:Transcript_30851/g.80499  ORF Transcript_30851/g.80499 Transcript_30851/m.80499 type:complete len:232 (+) Transcript_30851:1537-2232(+)
MQQLRWRRGDRVARRHCPLADSATAANPFCEFTRHPCEGVVAELEGGVGRRIGTEATKAVCMQLLRERAELVVLKVARENLLGKAVWVDDREDGRLSAKRDNIGPLAGENLGEFGEKGRHARAARRLRTTVTVVSDCARVHIHHRAPVRAVPLLAARTTLSVAATHGGRPHVASGCASGEAAFALCVSRRTSEARVLFLTRVTAVAAYAAARRPDPLPRQLAEMVWLQGER